MMNESTGVCERWILLQTDTAPLVIAISIQIFFSLVYGIIYYFLFRGKASVSKMHIFVWYVNTSTWGWLIYVFSYLAVCQGPVDTPLSITSLTFLGVLGSVGLVEMFCAGESGYFRHQMTMKECIEYMNQMRRTAPKHQIHVECYHYRTVHRTETYTDSNGNRQTRTITERKRVVTHRETRSFNYDRWSDDSDYPNLPEISMEFPIVAVNSSFTFGPGDKYTRSTFDSWRQDFISQMRRRDDHIDETEKKVLAGHIEKVSATSEKEGEVPWWLSCQLFYCLALLFCSCPLRVLFRSKAMKHTFVIRKFYYVDPVVTPGGGNVIVNIVDNAGIVHISGNPPAGYPMDTGGNPPAGYQMDIGGNNPAVNVGGNPPSVDIGANPPVVDIGGNPPAVDIGGNNPSVDIGAGGFAVDIGANPDGVILQPNNLQWPPTAPVDQAKPSWQNPDDVNFDANTNDVILLPPTAPVEQAPPSYYSAINSASAPSQPPTASHPFSEPSKSFGYSNKVASEVDSVKSDESDDSERTHQK